MALLGGISNHKEMDIPKMVARRDDDTDRANVDRKDVVTSKDDMGGMAIKDAESMSPTAFMASMMFAEANITSI